MVAGYAGLPVDELTVSLVETGAALPLLMTQLPNSSFAKIYLT